MSFANDNASSGSTPWLGRVKAAGRKVLTTAEYLHPAAGLVAIATVSYLAGPALSANWHGARGSAAAAPGIEKPAAGGSGGGSTPAAGDAAPVTGGAVGGLVPKAGPVPLAPLTLVGGAPPVVAPVVVPAAAAVVGAAKLDRYANSVMEIWRSGPGPAPAAPSPPVARAPQPSGAEKFNRLATAVGAAMRGTERPVATGRSVAGSGGSAAVASRGGYAGHAVSPAPAMPARANSAPRVAPRFNAPMGGRFPAFRAMPRPMMGGGFRGGGFGGFRGGGRR